MQYQQHSFYLCKTPLHATGENDVEILDTAADSESFPHLFKQFESLRSHAFNADQLYSITRAEDIFDLIRAPGERQAKEAAWEKAKPEIVTNLQHRIMQKGDKKAEAILRDIHDVT